MKLSSGSTAGISLFVLSCILISLPLPSLAHESHSPKQLEPRVEPKLLPTAPKTSTSISLPTPQILSIIRETIYLPQTSSSAKSGGKDFSQSEEIENCVITKTPPRDKSKPANILTTITKLKSLAPILTYAVHHPLRFIYYSLLPLLYRAFRLSLSYSWSATIFTTSLLAAPLHSLALFLLSPVFLMIRFSQFFAPVLFSLLAALLFGGMLGAGAGLISAEDTRKYVESVATAAQEFRDGYAIPASERVNEKVSELGKVEARWEKIVKQGAGRKLDEFGKDFNQLGGKGKSKAADFLYDSDEEDDEILGEQVEGERFGYDEKWRRATNRPKSSVGPGKNRFAYSQPVERKAMA